MIIFFVSILNQVKSGLRTSENIKMRRNIISLKNEYELKMKVLKSESINLIDKETITKRLDEIALGIRLTEEKLPRTGLILNLRKIFNENPKDEIWENN